jgi:hypothetical protein
MALFQCPVEDDYLADRISTYGLGRPRGARICGRFSRCRDIDRALAKGAEGAAQLTLRSAKFPGS